ncbi:MAG: flavin reductase family protein [Chitinophagales bacterium]
MILDLPNASTADKQHYLQHAIAPRPICFASTINKAGLVNLSPFSFFNLFSIEPPILIFSPSRRIRNNTIKHTLENVMEVPEVVIHIVDYAMVWQASLSSCEFPREVNEFKKAGFTEEPAALVRPPMVKESKIKFECKVEGIQSLGESGGSGNLVICRILRMHIDDSILDDKNKIDQRKIHHVARMGGDWYCKVDEHNLFTVHKPTTELGIGIDALPASIRQSRVLSGNHLGQLANIEGLPNPDPAFENPRLREIFQYFAINPEELEREIHLYAASLLNEGRTREAWLVLLSI